MNDACSIENLNAECFCLPLAASALRSAVATRLPATDVEWAGSALASLVAEQPLFLPATLEAELFDRVRAVGRALLALARDGGTQDEATVLAAAAFDSFDFHLASTGPKLIEVNTNAGGAFLQPLLHEALTETAAASWFEPERVLLDAFAALAPQRRLERLAIVDVRPQEQPLYLDMRLAAVALEARGIGVDILDLEQLFRADGRLCGPAGPIDMVYNRLTDFELAPPASAQLRDAWLAGEVVLTPNPDVYRTFADKHLLIALSDPDQVRTLAATGGFEAERVLDTLLPCSEISTENAAALWDQRRDYVFKPGRGHGSRGVYRGDKISRSKWQQIVGEGYLAQRFAAPSLRSLRIEGGITPFKVDIRVWTHGIEPVFTAARLYSGQVMGFRSEGAGFAPIIWMDPAQSTAGCRDLSAFRALCRESCTGGAR